MKIFVLAALLAAASAQNTFLEDGQEMVFDTQAAASAGSMDYATHTSGFSYKMRTRVQIDGRRLNLKFEDLTFTQYVGAHEAKAWPYDDQTWTSIPANPEPFAIQLDSDGLFKELIVPSGSSVFERNMMRAWASQLQINAGEIRNGNRGFKSKEQSVNGVCDVTYSVSPQAVRKTVSHVDDCEQRVFRIVDDYRYFRCDGKTMSSGPGYPSSLSTTVFKVRPDGNRFRIDAIMNSGTFIAQFFEEEGAAQAVYTNQTSIIVERKSSSGDISVSGGDSITDLSYEWADQDYKWDQDRDLKAKEPFFATGEYFEDDDATVRQVIIKGIEAQKDIISNLDQTDANIQKAHKAGINAILPAFMALDYNNLKSIADQLYADKSEAGVSKANVFGELLGSAGTTAAALVVRDLLLENKFDNARDAARILTAIPYHIRRPNTQLVKEFEPLLKEDTERMVAQSVPLVFGHMVRMVCTRAGNPASDEQKKCFKEFAGGYVQKFFDRLKSTSDRKEKGLIVAALYNMRFGGQSKILRPLIMGEMDADDAQLRVGALHAASWEAIVSGQASEFFLPIFADANMNHEMRISALELMLHSKPTASDIANVVATLYGEKNYELINYAYALFQRWADSLDNCQAETRDLIQYFLKYMTQYSNYEPTFGFGISKTYARSFYKKKYGYGGNYMFYVVGSDKSFAPLSFGATMGSSFMGNMKSNLLGFHFRVEGLAKGLINKLKTTDPTTWKTEDLQKILFNEMEIREREDQPIRVQITLTLKGAIVFHRYYDDDSAKPDGHIMKFIEQFKGLGDEYTINHQRAVNLGGFLYEQPTPLGLPMGVISSTTSLSSLRATVKRGSSRGLMYRDLEYDYHAFTQSARAAFVRHPARKVSYGILNDRIYHVHVPRKIVAGVNPIKREIKLSISRPEYNNPWRIFMHSQTVVLARGNNVKGDYNDLQGNCPSCQTRVIVSKGPEYIKDRSFIDRESSKYGYAIKGNYFNCEMDIRKKNTFKHLIGAFVPYNKTPKTLYNSIFMGLRQIRAFFYFFPKNEQCGAELRWSQSQTNPTTGIEISLRGNGEPNGDRMFFRGKKIFMKALIKAKGNPEDRAYRVNMAYEYTPGNLKNKFKIQINRAPANKLGIPAYSLCFMLENEYPDFSTEFLGYDENNDMKVTGKAMIQYGEASTCAQGDGEIKVKFEHSTTSEARQQLQNKWYYKQCMEQANTPAWKGRNSLPVSEPCFMTVYDATTARKYSWDIELSKVSDRLQRIGARVKTLAEAGILPFWDADPEDDTDDGTIGPYLNLDVQFKNDEATMDLKTETARGTKEYKDVALRLDWTKKLRNLKFTGTLKKLFYMKIINPCIVTSTDVRTNDNVTYTYSPSPCWTLTSAKCGPSSDYAVFTKRSPGLPLAAKAYIGGHVVDFTPAGNAVTLSINGSPVNIAAGEQQDLTEDGVEIFKVFRWGSSYHVYSFLRVWISYDGNFVEVVPAPSALGQHCGICGNYNRNQFDEFTGKDMELFDNSADLVENWKWKC